MSTKILAIGDVHFKVGNIPEVDFFIEKIQKLAQDENPDLIVILGDVLDTHEKLHTIPLNRATIFFDKMRKIAETYVLVGNHDMCFGIDTEFLRYKFEKINGEYVIYQNPVKVQDIKVGYNLVGPDSIPRRVINTNKGRSMLFEITCFNSKHIVSYNHIISLFRYRSYNPSRRIFRMITDDLEFVEKSIYSLSLEERRDIFSDLMNKEKSFIDIPLSKYLELPFIVKQHLFAFQISNGIKNYSSISIKSIGIGEYYGFEVNIDNRILLSNGVLVHNCNNQQFLNENHWMNPFKNWDGITIIDKVNVVEKGDETFTLCPYVPPGRFIEALDTVKGWKDSSLIFAHQEFKNCKMGCITSVEGDEWPLNLPMVISGHIHSKDRLQKNIYYTGSAMQHAFGESEKNTVAILTVKNKKCNIKEIDLELPRKKIQYVDLDRIEEYLQTIDTMSKDKLKISLCGDFQDFKTFTKTKIYKELIENGIKLKYNKNKASLVEFNKEEIAKDIDFNSLLYEKIHSERNPFLTAIYEKIFLGSNITEKDIFYI